MNTEDIEFKKHIISILSISKSGALNCADEIEDIKYKERCLERVYNTLSVHIIPFLVQKRILESNKYLEGLIDTSFLESKLT